MFARALEVLVNGVALAAAAEVTLAHPTSAQTHPRFEIAPALGVYLPSRQLPLGPTPAICVEDENGQCRTFFLEQSGAVAVGGRVTVWLNNRGAVEGLFWYSPSGVTGFVVEDYEGAGNVVMASLRFVASLAPRARTMSVLLMGGPAVIHHSGDYYSDLRGATSFAGVLGIGLDIHPGRRFSFRAEVEDYVYSAQLASGIPMGSTTAGPRTLHHDFVLSLSISAFGQRGASLTMVIVGAEWPLVFLVPSVVRRIDA